MNGYYSSSYQNDEPYTPRSLGDIYDLIGSMMLGAPTFVDRTGFFPERNIDTEFQALVRGFDEMKNKLGDERHERLTSLAGQAKDLFAADPDGASDQTDRGIALLQDMEEIVQAVRTRRVKEKLPDEDGEVTGD